MRRKNQVDRPLVPAELEALAQAVAKYEGIIIESARWYAIGMYHGLEAQLGAETAKRRCLATARAFVALTRTTDKTAKAS